MEHDSFFGFAKDILKQVPGKVLKALPMTIGSGILMWLLHTFLLVYVNEGFRAGTWLGNNVLNVRGRLISSTILWGILGMLVPMSISFFQKGGNLGQKISGIFQLPGILSQSNQRTQGSLLPMMLFSMAGALLLERLLSGFCAALLGALVANAVVSFVTGSGSLLVMTFRMIWNDFQRGVLKRYYALQEEDILVIMGGGAMVLMGVGLLRSVIWIPSLLLYMAIIGLVIAGVVLKNQNKPPQSGTFSVFFWVMIVSAISIRILSQEIFGDDGGWREAGGTFGSWISSEGAAVAIMSGVPPSLAALMGSFLQSIFSNVLPSGGWMPDLRDFNAGGEFPPTYGNETMTIPDETGQNQTYTLDPTTGAWCDSNGACISGKNMANYQQALNEEQGTQGSMEVEQEDGSYVTYTRNPQTGNWISPDGNLMISRADMDQYQRDLEQAKRDRQAEIDDMKRWSDAERERFRNKEIETEQLNKWLAEEAAARRAEREEAERIEIQRRVLLELLALKHGVYDSRYDYTQGKPLEILKKMISMQQGVDAADSRVHMEEADAITDSMEYLKHVETAADFGVDAFEVAIGPAGKGIKRAYVVIKNVAAGASDTYNSGEGMASGAVRGAIKAGIEVAGDHLGVGEGEAKSKGGTVLNFVKKVGVKVGAETSYTLTGEDGLEKTDFVGTTVQAVIEEGIGRLEGPFDVLIGKRGLADKVKNEKIKKFIKGKVMAGGVTMIEKMATTNMDN